MESKFNAVYRIAPMILVQIQHLGIGLCDILCLYVPVCVRQKNHTILHAFELMCRLIWFLFFILVMLCFVEMDACCCF